MIAEHDVRGLEIPDLFIVDVQALTVTAEPVQRLIRSTIRFPAALFPRKHGAMLTATALTA